jgi:hypothetical protein
VSSEEEKVASMTAFLTGFIYSILTKDPLPVWGKTLALVPEGTIKLQLRNGMIATIQVKVNPRET